MNDFICIKGKIYNISQFTKVYFHIEKSSGSEHLVLDRQSYGDSISFQIGKLLTANEAKAIYNLFLNKCLLVIGM